MTPGYPYNVEANYGPVSIVSSEDAAKMGGHPGMPGSQPSGGPGAPHQQQSGMSSIKDERNKESPSPHENSKHSSQQPQVRNQRNCYFSDVLYLFFISF